MGVLLLAYNMYERVVIGLSRRSNEGGGMQR